MLLYKSYFKEFLVRRPSGIAKVHAYSNFTELPLNGVLHIGEAYKKEVSKTTLPVPHHTEFAHLAEDKLIRILFSTLSSPEFTVVPPDSKVIPHTSEIITHIRKYRDGHIKIAKSPEDFQNGIKYLNVVSYDPHYCGRIVGYMQTYRMINLLLDRMVTIVAKDSRDHFILIPTMDEQFRETDFIKTYKKHDNNSMMGKSPYFIIMAHLMGYLRSDRTMSLFSQFDPNLFKRMNFIFYNIESDRSIHLRLDLLKAFGVKDKAYYKKVLRTINFISRAPQVLEAQIEEDVELLEVNATIGEGGVINTTSGSNRPAEEELADKHTAYIEKRKNEAVRKILENIETTTPQKKMAMKIVAAHESIEIDGINVGELLKEPTPPLIGVDASDVVGDLPDKSFCQSSIINSATEYSKREQLRHTVGILTSFGVQDLHLVGLKQEPIVDDFSKIVRYSAQFKNSTGESTTIRFRLPIIEEDGTFTVNGSKKRVTNQRLNLPICKVSPTRVTLNSNFNKSMIETSDKFSNSLLAQVKRMLLKTKLPIYGQLGGSVDRKCTLPYEYAALGKVYTSIKGESFKLIFKYESRFEGLKDADVEALKAEEVSKKAIYLGYIEKEKLFMDIGGYVSYKEEPHRIIDLLDTLIYDVQIKPYNEWTTIMIVNTKFPCMFLLAYRYGFETTLRTLGAKYDKIPRGERVSAKASDIVVKTFDMTFVIRNPTTVNRLIISGINDYSLEDFDHSVLEEKDAYFTLLQDKGITVSYLREIDSFFDNFVDFITAGILRGMGEPDTFRGLILRSNALLATSEHMDPASSTMYRTRNCELMNAILAKTLSRAVATHTKRSRGHGSKVSISEYEVLSTFMSDALVSNVDTLNPIGNLQSRLKITHLGDGGRTAQAMMVSDRRFPDDGMGTLSESTPVSGNVGIDGVLPVNPTILHLDGVAMTLDPSMLEPGNILSPTALLYPGATMDDGKRVLFISAQMKQAMPTKAKTHSRVRTGFERAMAHLVNLPFAYVAEDEGQITELDEENNILEIRYKNQEKPVVVHYGMEYTRHSSANIYIPQTLMLRKGLKERSKLKKGDIIIYNDNYFSIDPLSEQADYHLGYFCNVAFVDKERTIEDACAISSKLSKELGINPVEMREMVIPKGSRVHSFANIGDIVRKADPILIFEEQDIGETTNPDMKELLTRLNRSIPKAKHAGKIVRIDLFHRCNKGELSPSLRRLDAYVNKKKNAKAAFAKDSRNSLEYISADPIKTDKVRGITLTLDDVVIRFYIEEDIDMSSPDKLAWGAAVKSVCSGIMTHEVIAAGDGRVVDGIMSGSSVQNRCVPSCAFSGSLETYMEKVESLFLDALFDT